MDRQAESDRGGLDRRQRANVVVERAVISFLLRRIGREDRGGRTERLAQHRGQRQRPVQTLAGKLAQTGGGFLAMADDDDRFSLGRGSVFSLWRVDIGQAYRCLFFQRRHHR